MDENYFFNNLLPYEIVKTCQKAAIAAYELFGKGDEKGADGLAVEAMRLALNNLDIDGTIVIGEGERDKAPMLYIGEKVGNGYGLKLDIAVDPLEGTTILATGGADSLSVIAVAKQGGFLNAPDIYMEKIAIGFHHHEQIIDLDNSLTTNLKNITKAKKCNISDLVVIILNRPRHHELIAKVRESGARVKLINDGDIAAVIATTLPHIKGDVYMGIGGAPEGVLAAAALRTSEGQMCARLLFQDDTQKKRAYNMGITDISKQYLLQDLAKEGVIFAATGITEGAILDGVRFSRNSIVTHSILMCSYNQSMIDIRTHQKTY